MEADLGRISQLACSHVVDPRVFNTGSADELAAAGSAFGSAADCPSARYNPARYTAVYRQVPRGGPTVRTPDRFCPGTRRTGSTARLG
jgi:hypothetical protein